MPAPGHVDAAIALGSNLGDRAATIASALCAVAAIPGIELVAEGPVIETQAVGAPPNAPGATDPGGPYLNSAAIIRTTLRPLELLARLQEIERAHGRTREHGQRWAPRTLDLDLILYNAQIISIPGLTIPHPRMHERQFVLAPLAALAPGWIVPTLGRTVAELLAELRSGQGVKP